MQCQAGVLGSRRQCVKKRLPDSLYCWQHAGDVKLLNPLEPHITMNYSGKPFRCLPLEPDAEFNLCEFGFQAIRELEEWFGTFPTTKWKEIHDSY